MTPAAPQRASFQKDHAPDPRAVCNSEPFNVKDQCFLFSRCFQKILLEDQIPPRIRIGGIMLQETAMGFLFSKIALDDMLFTAE